MTPGLKMLIPIEKNTGCIQTKLSPSNIRMIRKLLASGLSTAQVAQHYPVCQETISAISRGVIWKDVD